MLRCTDLVACIHLLDHKLLPLCSNASFEGFVDANIKELT
jgi:hypothetical protein